MVTTLVQRLKKRFTSFDDLDKALYLWIKQARAMNIPINGPIIMEKANSLAKELELDFKANSGWLYRFKIRRSLVFKNVCGESGTVTLNMTDEWRNQKLPSILSKYSPDDIYNADETGLFYQCLPNKTYTLKGEKASHGLKESKQRLTVLVATNMSGSDKVAPLIIGKSAKPRCFSGKKIPFPYQSNSKAWMTGTIWTEWI